MCTRRYYKYYSVSIVMTSSAAEGGRANHRRETHYTYNLTVNIRVSVCVCACVRVYGMNLIASCTRTIPIRMQRKRYMSDGRDVQQS